MNPAAPFRSRAQKIGEISLWAGASAFVLTAHIAAAALMMQEEPTMPADNAPPSAIMIELAPEPEATQTEEEQIAPDASDSEKVESEQMQPVEEAQPEPTPDPIEPPPPEIAEPLPEPPPPEPVEEPTPPEPEVAETLPEPPPEPIEQPDPIEQQVMAALDNVEVPLPVVRPPPPPEKPEVAEKKPEPKKEPVKRVERRKQQQAQKEMAQAKAEAAESDRNAATQTSSGSRFSSLSPATWKSRVQSRLARNARRCPGGNTGTAAVRFNFDNGGNVTSVSLQRSSGDTKIDDYIVSIVRRASPIPAPPAGVPNFLTQALTCS